MGIIFTPQQLKSLKATGRRQELRDLKGENLYVVVQPKSGEVSFVVRMMVDGKQRKKTLGSFPYLGLADAREMAAEIKRALKRGERPPIPIGPQNALPEPATRITVTEAWDLYWEHEASARKSAQEKQRIYEKEVKPLIGDLPLAEVTSGSLAAIIRSKFATAKTSSNRLHSLLARFFKWSFTHGHSLTGLTTNPMASVPKMFSERDTARQRYFTPQELTWWLQSVDAAGAYRPIHELLMRTLCRFSDIMGLTWGEVTQLENGDPVLMLSDTKNNQAHLVYLHPSAEKLLPMRPNGAKPTDRVFRPVSRSGKPVDRIRARMQTLADAEGASIGHWQPHDYRRTGTTHIAGFLDENDDPLVADHILDRLLAHKEQRVIRHYNQYGYYKDKKKALFHWNRYLDDLIH